VSAAHRFAIANELIVSDMVELTEFPHFAVKYNVQGVPKIIINEKHTIEGSVDDREFVREILKAIGK
jgi:predicted DsbA family dithiol-disulfide isomerase